MKGNKEINIEKKLGPAIREYENIEKKGLRTVVYIGFTLLLYLVYILFAGNRLRLIEKLGDTISPTKEVFVTIEKLDFWAGIAGVLFIVLFMIVPILLFRFQMNWSSFLRFIILQLCLLLAIFIVGYVLSFFFTLSMRTIAEPLIFSFILFVTMVLSKILLEKRIK